MAYQKRTKNTKARATRKNTRTANPKTKGGKMINYLSANYKKPYKYPNLGYNIGHTIGNAISPRFGGPIGGLIGKGAHALTKTITGFGDYTVKENALMYNRDAVPEFAQSSEYCTVLTHTEFIKDVKGSTTFQIDSFDINASNSALFPWLSQIARNYEQIIFQGLIFQFKTTSATAIGSTNTALGTVIMATQYNVLAEEFINKQQMENYQFSQSGVPCASLIHGIECSPDQTFNRGMFYTDLPSNNQSGADPRLYNLGRFNIATVGMQAASVIGELSVSYKVSLLKPRQVGNSNMSDQWILDYATLSDAVPYGSYPVLTSSSTSSMYNIARQFNPYPSDQSFTSIRINPWNAFAIDEQEIYVNPSFTGQLVVVYQVNTDGVAACNEPAFGVAGNITIISDPSIGTGFVSLDINNCAGGFHAVAAFQVQGGYNSAGIVPTIIIGGGSYPGASDNVIQGSLAIYAVANNLRNPANPA